MTSNSGPNRCILLLRRRGDVLLCCYGHWRIRHLDILELVLADRPQRVRVYLTAKVVSSDLRSLLGSHVCVCVCVSSEFNVQTPPATPKRTRPAMAFLTR